VLEHPDAADMGGIVGALLGLQFAGYTAVGTTGGQSEDHHAFGFSQDEIQAIASGLGPGESAGIVLIEHVWARDLRKAFRGLGGNILGEGFLTPETIRAVEPELAAISDAVAATERGSAQA
jgi:uncharacterized membrane protein